MPNITLPTPGGDEDTWAPILNAAITDINDAVDEQADQIADKLNSADAPELIRDTMGSTLVAGSNVTITVDDPGDTITISASGGGGGGAVDSVNGQTGVVVLDADDIGDGSTKVQMTTAERSKLAGIASGAQVNTVTSVAGRTGAVTLTKTDVGLGNVDNTSDLNKPVSTATQSALDLKADTADLGTAAFEDSTSFATAAQGSLADSATQPGDLSTVATTGAYADLSGKPTLGTAAAASTTDFATAAQGTKADTAVQPAALSVKENVLTAGANITINRTDPANPIISASGGGGGAGDWGSIGGTLSDQTDLQAALDAKADAADLATVATSGSYNDLTDKPTIPDAADFWPLGEATTDLSTTRGSSGIAVTTTAATLLGSSSVSVRSPNTASVGLDGGENAWAAYKPGGVPTLAAFIDNAPVMTVDDTGAEFLTPVAFTDAVTVPDGSFTIAKTSGLQAALDSKQSTITNSDSITQGSTNLFMTGAERTKLSGIAAGAQVNTVDSVNSKTGTVVLTQDDVASGTTNKAFTATEQTKLSGIATGATANSSDATLLNRANHTGTQTASTISDFNTAADARITASTTIVKTTGNQSIAGTKTFTSAPAVPDASFSIAKTNGLQTALDAKVGSSNSSVSGVEYYPTVGDLPNPGVAGVIYFVDAA